MGWADPGQGGPVDGPEPRQGAWIKPLMPYLPGDSVRRVSRSLDSWNVDALQALDPQDLSRLYEWANGPATHSEVALPANLNDLALVHAVGAQTADAAR